MNTMGYVNNKPARMEKLDLGSLPSGAKSKVRVEIVHDGLGRAVTIPVLVIKGLKDGPVFGVTAALHGDELNGIPVIHRLVERIDPTKLRGTLVAVAVVNVPGFLMRQRELNHGADLNHRMPGVSNGNEADVYAHRLLNRIIRKFNYLVDLHTASFGRINSLYVRADMTSDTASRMAYLQRPQIILHNPPSDCTLRGAAEELGCHAITIEIGNPNVFQPEQIRKTLIGLRSVMAEAKMIPKRHVAHGPPPILCRGSAWLYTDAGGLLEVFPRVTEMVEKGDLIARLTNPFGEVTREYRSPREGIVIGKSVSPVAQTGARILHLGTIADKTDRQFLKRDQ